MNPDAARRGPSDGRYLSYQETAYELQARFGWKPGVFASLLVRVLSLVLEPLDRGTYRGRKLEGEPHRPRPVTVNNLTVFVLPEGRRQRLYLAARLRHWGLINVIQDPAVGPQPTPFGAWGRKWGSMNMEALVGIQLASEAGITVVPLTHAYHQHHPECIPTSFGTRLYMLTPMHLWRRAASFARTVHTARLRNCRPIELEEWLLRNPRTGPGSRATALHKEVIGRVESECRAILGPPLPQPWEVRKSVLRDPILVEFMRGHADWEGRSLRKVRKEARRHIREIASKIRAGVARYVGIILDIGFKQLLTGFEIDPEGIRFISECDSASRLVLVCCHKSYMDPLILAYAMGRSGLMLPQQAAGINLNIWPLGWILRRCGGFYLRRSFVDEPVYREAFNAYTRRLLADNYVTAFYIEGTRSRDGKLRQPKTGFMKILDEAVRFGACESVTVIPVYLGYDRVPEEGAHVREMSGGHKIPETWNLFKRLYKSVTATLGHAYVKFGPPVDFGGIVNRYGPGPAAEFICERLDEITMVTARSVASAALLFPGGRRVASADFERAAADLLSLCRGLGLPMAYDADMPGIRATVDWLAEENRVVVEEGDGGEEHLVVEGDRRRSLEFNKNILLAHLLGPALAAAAERGDGAPGESAGFLVALFDEEFVTGPGFEGKVRIPAGAAPGLLASLLDSFLEGYLVACVAIGTISPGEHVESRDLVERCFEQGWRMLEEGSVRRLEALSRIIFENALRRFEQMRLLSGHGRPAGKGKREKTVTTFIRGELFGDRPDLEKRIAGFLGQRDRVR